VPRPAADVEVLRAATRRLLRTVDGITEEQAREPSRLPGWNRAELLAHLARNADGTRGMIEAAARGEVAAMYPGGAEQRNAGIAAGRDERAAVLLADLRRSCDDLDEAWGALSGDAWDRVGRTSVERTMRELPWVRWREVEIHHVDLAMGYEPSDWPVGFVRSAFGEIFSTFERRSSNTRPLIDSSFRVVSTDHERGWRVRLHGRDVQVAPDDGDDADGVAFGWGCDLVAWLYGRDPRASSITTSGDPAVLRLPQWFPFG